MSDDLFTNIDKLEGRKEAVAFIINNMLEEGSSMEFSEKVTELKEDDIKYLLREQNKKFREARRLNLLREFGLLDEKIE